jgi:hypothetical protein
VPDVDADKTQAYTGVIYTIDDSATWMRVAAVVIQFSQSRIPHNHGSNFLTPNNVVRTMLRK